MLDDQLAAAGEEIGQGFAAVGPLEEVVLLDLDPGQLAALAGDFVLGAQMRLLLLEQGAAGGDPFLAGDDLVRLHDDSSTRVVRDENEHG